ncbi:methyltransferase, TIGR04325 family [Pseudanabaena mucicola]|uniref:Methyltransferase, TIGR04325 family n=1 Tax=Pseudanabaena mucicola FACHB-723 TaxID=2692860 RepID=A0ABR7ZSZ9_9CYAN|nr:methyltransferase, TIGR04325 family [Pseudanabaena mucicola]MBD2187103.1 methyltransferase, TIGR04325 family [Pseudanabaena mucicola FACHB-723]
MIRDLLPPIIFKILQKIKSKVSFRISPSEEKLYQSYEEALANCTKNGYEDDLLTNVILFKTINYAKILENNYLKLTPTTAFSLSALASIVSAKARKSLTVVDVGGACGVHYFEFRKVCDPSLSIQWYVVETATMAQKAKNTLQSEELHFVDSLDEVLGLINEPIDLLHTSGTLQCVPNPLTFLNKILNSNADYILFNRLGLNRTDETDVIKIHFSRLSSNGVGTDLPSGVEDRLLSYPFTFLSEKKFLSKVFENKNYEILTSYNDLTGIFSIPSYEIVGGGYLLKKVIPVDLG